MYNILICDDEKDIVSALDIYLKTAGYEVYRAYNGAEAIDVVRANEIHLVLMDVMMPVMDGITAMAKIRELCNVPVIMLTAKSEDTDKILGLEVGADDYVTKPFNPVELLARVKSQLRRYMQLGGGGVKPGKLVIGGIELDDMSKQVTLDGELMALTPTEYDILKLLMENRGRVFSTKEIYRAVRHLIRRQIIPLIRLIILRHRHTVVGHLQKSVLGCLQVCLCVIRHVSYCLAVHRIVLLCLHSPIRHLKHRCISYIHIAYAIVTICVCIGGCHRHTFVVRIRKLLVFLGMLLWQPVLKPAGGQIIPCVEIVNTQDIVAVHIPLFILII